MQDDVMVPELQNLKFLHFHTVSVIHYTL